MKNSEKAISVIKANGGRITSQRLMILDILKENKNHPGADDIYNEISKTTENISAATVYNTLDILEEYGFINKLSTPEGKFRYDPDTEPHGHLFCTVCKKLTDIPITNINGLDFQGYEIKNILINGVCPICQKNKRKNNE